MPRHVSVACALRLITLGVALTSACSHPRPITASQGLAREGHCWWAVLRSSRPPDSIAARFVRRYIDVGYSAVSYKKRADTAWATAEATDFYQQRARIASRAIAYWHGDSSHFRYFVTVEPRNSGEDSLDTGKLLIDMCARVARAAAIGWSAPTDPTGEESLELWKRRP